MSRGACQCRCNHLCVDSSRYDNDRLRLCILRGPNMLCLQCITAWHGTAVYAHHWIRMLIFGIFHLHLQLVACWTHRNGAVVADQGHQVIHPKWVLPCEARLHGDGSWGWVRQVCVVQPGGTWGVYAARSTLPCVLQWLAGIVTCMPAFNATCNDPPRYPGHQGM